MMRNEQYKIFLALPLAAFHINQCVCASGNALRERIQYDKVNTNPIMHRLRCKTYLTVIYLIMRHHLQSIADIQLYALEKITADMSKNGQLTPLPSRWMNRSTNKMQEMCFALLAEPPL